MTKIVTAGQPYLDIDSYAGIIAYAELLRLLGFEAKAVSTSPLNMSVTKTIRSWSVDFLDSYKVNTEDSFTVIDVSEPKHLDRIVDLKKVEAIFDHHPGFEQYWYDKIGDKALIQPVGSACTLVYESWLENNMLPEMSMNSVNLLICGILDNTLNFSAKITKHRDKDAYEALIKISDLPEDWPEKYFTECSQSILDNLEESIVSDTKVLRFRTREGDVAVGQLAVWDGAAIADIRQPEIVSALEGVKDAWFINIASIGDGMSFFVSNNKVIQDWLSDLLGVSFSNNIAAADRLWLRKEILHQDIEFQTKDVSNED